MGIISNLIAAATGNEAETEQSISTKLSALDAERRAAREKIQQALSKRAELLLVDGTDREIAKLDAEVDAARLVVERLDAIQPHLYARLAELRDAARQAAWKAIADRHHDALESHVRAVKAALASADAVIAARDAAMEAGFTNEAKAMLEPLQYLNEEALQNYIVHCNRHAAARAASNN